MKRLSKQFILHFDKTVRDTRIFENCIVEADAEEKMGKIIGWVGEDQEEKNKKKFKFGWRVLLTDCRSKTRYLPDEHIEYQDSFITKVSTKYITKSEIHKLRDVCGYDNLFDALEKHDGVIDDKMIEYLFSLVKINFFTSKDALITGPTILKERSDLKQITPMSALKKYGIDTVEIACDKKYASIKRAIA